MMNIAVLPTDWSVFTRISVLAAILCLIAVIVLVVPSLFEHVRRLRANRRMDAEMQAMTKYSNLSVASPRTDRIVSPNNAPTTPLGWTSEGDEDGSAIPWKTSHGKHGPVENREKTVLVADDDPVVVHALLRRLEHLGYQVFRSPDAAHALMGAMKVLPDLVILDVNMPGGNGLAVCEMMASDPRFSGIPVIIHSVIADEAAKERTRRLGAHYVEKSPQSWAEIKTLVENLIGEHSQPATAQQPSQPLCCDKDAVPSQKKETPPTQPEASGTEAVQKPIAAPAAPSPAPTPPTPPMCGRSKVLCIETPDDRLEYVDHQLSAIGMEVARTGDMDQGFWACFTEKPSVIVIQCANDRKKLLALLQRLTDHPVTRKIPVLVINEGDLLADCEVLLNNNVKVVKFPLDWEDFLGELEKLVPMFGHEPGDPMAISEHPSPETGVVDVPPVDSGVLPTENDSEQQPIKLLCIDDDPVVTQSINIRLQPYRIKVDWACNGMQGYLAAVAQQPNLILLDLNMPNGEGGYVLTKLKDNEHTKNIPVIILTVESHPGVRRKLLAVGAEAFLTKPVRWPDLFQEMGRCIQLPEQLLADYHLTPQLTLAQI
jgi:CheY-like chemotaxis protein